MNLPENSATRRSFEQTHLARRRKPTTDPKTIRSMFGANVKVQHRPPRGDT